MKKTIIEKPLINIFGLEVNKPELVIIASGTILLPFLVPAYSIYAGLNWTILQILIAYGMAFDIMSGCLVYNSFHHKKISFEDNGMGKKVKHALLHMQPLVAASFFTEELLLYIGLYWFLMYILFISLFEPYSRVSKKTENLITCTLIAANLLFLFLCFSMIKDQSLLIYGTFIYIVSALFTFVQCLLPLRSRRLFGTGIVVLMSVLNIIFLEAPEGFEWFLPVLTVKLFMGYNALENISSKE